MRRRSASIPCSWLIGLLVLAWCVVLSATVVRADDCSKTGNSPETACTLAAGSSVEGTIGEDGGVNIYRVAVAASGTELHAQLTNLPADYDLYLIDSANQIISQSVQPGASPEDILIDLPDAGTYYIHVVSSPGQGFDPDNAYTLSVTLTPPALEANPMAAPIAPTAAPTAAPPPTVGAINTASGAITFDGQKDSYSIDGQQGAVLEAHVVRSSGISLNLSIQLIDPNGQREDSNGCGSELTLDHRLASGGTYTLQIAACGGAGPYDLSWSVGRLTPLTQSPAHGQLSYEHQRDRYLVDGQQGQVFEAWAKRSSGISLSMSVELIDPAGQREDSNGCSSELTLDHALASSGTYTVIVSSCSGTGPYDLTWAVGRVTKVNNQTSTSASMQYEHQRDRYTADLQQGQSIAANAKRTSGVSLSVGVELFDPSGHREDSNGCGPDVTVNHKVASSGTYTIIVSSCSGTGPYVLQVGWK